MGKVTLTLVLIVWAVRLQLGQSQVYIPTGNSAKQVVSGRNQVESRSDAAGFTSSGQSALPVVNLTPVEKKTPDEAIQVGENIGVVEKQATYYHQNKPVAYAKDLYYYSPNHEDPFFLMNNKAGFQISAVFGQIFWGILAVTATLGVSMMLVNYFSGTKLVRGIMERFRSGKAFSFTESEIDYVARMLTKAIEKFGQDWIPHEMQHYKSLGDLGDEKKPT